jgi:DNA (cytosine-5)-methyltransferase 1
VNAIDMFAGAGGFSTGAAAAGCTVVWAANHWPTAVEWHAANHPGTEHACQDLQQADFRDVPAHDLLLASPACQGHSKARGEEKPHHDALRATAWAVVTCAEVHRPQAFIVENVPDYAKWVLYQAWCAAMHALGYALAPMLVDCADLGASQSRPRLFIVGTRSKHPVQLNLPKRDPRPAAEVIDFNAGNWSRVADKVPRTQRLVAVGRAELGERFLLPYYGSTRTGRSLARPIGTLTTVDRYAVINGDRIRMVSIPEAKRFMGLPADYQLPEDHKTAMKMIGNAVHVLAACEVINGLKRAA